MKGPEGEKSDKRTEKDPLEVASYDKPWWLRAYSLPGTPRDNDCQNCLKKKNKERKQYIIIVVVRVAGVVLVSYVVVCVVVQLLLL